MNRVIYRSSRKAARQARAAGAVQDAMFVAAWQRLVVFGMPELAAIDNAAFVMRSL